MVPSLAKTHKPSRDAGLPTPSPYHRLSVALPQLPLPNTLPIGVVIWSTEFVKTPSLVLGTCNPLLSRPCRAYPWNVTARRSHLFWPSQCHSSPAVDPDRYPYEDA